MAEGSRGGGLAGRIRRWQTRRWSGPRGLGGGRGSPRPVLAPVGTAFVGRNRRQLRGAPRLPAKAEPGAPLPTAEAALTPPAPAGQPVAPEPPPAVALAPQPETGQPLVAERSVPARIYSAADPDVVPPRLMRPAPAAAANAGGAAEDPTVEVELVVSAAGTVESARLIPPGSGPRAATMISAVKAWTFEPATLGGESVRYRHRLRLPAR